MTRNLKFFLITLLIGSLQGIYAQVSFSKDELYHISPKQYPEKVLTMESGKALHALAEVHGHVKWQQLSVTELSGSFGVISLCENKALYARVDNVLGVTDNKGSDESQLWTVKQKGDAVLIIPTNTPELMLVCNPQGALTLLPKKQAENMPEALFFIKASGMKLPAGVWGNSANRPQQNWEDETRFGAQ